MSSDHLERVKVVRKDGSELFRDGEHQLGFDVRDFWAWSCSDLLSNATRGVVAEFLVARALGIGRTDVRDEWAAYDLNSSEGIKIEVKSAAYLQSWKQSKLSAITFRVQKSRAWDPETNIMADEVMRQADVYVFALLAHTDKRTVDPLDVGQWEFFVLPTSVLDRRERSQHSITLRSLKQLAGEPVCFSDLGRVVSRTVERP